MTKYEAQIEIPYFKDPADLQAFVEALREFGHPTLVWRTEAKDKHEAAAEVANSVSVFWAYNRFDKDWWMGKLRALRGHKAKEEI